MPPLGFFDPLNFSKPGRPLGVYLQDLSDEEKFAWLRAAELKNGRVAMMATVGAVFQHFVRLPGFESMPAGIKAIEKAPGSYGFVILWILAGVLELGPWRQVADKGVIDLLAFGEAISVGPEIHCPMHDYVGLCSQRVAAPLFVPGAPSTQGTQAPRTAAHAAAQTPSSGLSAATVGTVASAGMGVLVAALSRASVGRTSRPHVARNFFGGPTSTPASFDPATELGVQDPVGFWDPLGLAADKDKATFNRRRAVELKHGRIAMYATIGYIVPEYFRWPGFLSPSLGLKFSDMPNGLAALSKLPVLGGAQIIAFAGLIETTGFFQAASTTDGRGPREGQFSMKDSTERLGGMQPACST
ncbi:FCPF, partial [Symbiodinium sp. CCMP2592]